MPHPLENKVSQGICVARRLEISKTDKDGDWNEVSINLKLISTTLPRPFYKSVYEGETFYDVTLIECSPAWVGFSKEDFENSFLVVFEE